ncbi:MAG: DUF3784 domain-containing protein [Clostridiaceae bacterium]|nr:DUF3784 domain-containing protein [Clostridiaceae bacterium]
MWFFLVGAVFIAIGIMVQVFKWYFLISGYNTMPKEKKAKVDTKGLGRLMGIYSYFNGSVFIVLGVLDVLGLEPNVPAVAVIFCISTVCMLIRAQKYDGNIYDEKGKLRKGEAVKIVLSIGITAITLIFVLVLLFFSTQDTKVTVTEEGLRIHGMYGGFYAWESIDDVKLMGELPTIRIRTNGSAVGSKLKGYFKTKELGSVKLHVDTKSSPFVFLYTEKGITIFNLKDAEETKKVYEDILRLRK